MGLRAWNSPMQWEWRDWTGATLLFMGAVLLGWELTWPMSVGFGLLLVGLGLLRLR